MKLVQKDDGKTDDSVTGIHADAGHGAGLIHRLNPDIWYLILRNLDAQGDLCTLSLVSKDLCHLVIPHLYRTLVLGPRPLEYLDYLQAFHDPENNLKRKSRETQWSDSLALIRRLVGNPNGQQAHAVREIEVVALGEQEENVAAELEHKEGLAALVKALPNLQQFRLRSSTPAFEHLIRALNEHDNQPQLHLLGEDGSRAVAGPMPSVATLRADVNPYYEQAGKANRQIPGLQKLFFACSNLKLFSLSIHGNYGGCVIRIPRHPQVDSFQLTGEETFPPLESLSLDGYYMHDDEQAEDDDEVVNVNEPQEWAHWRDKLDWANLKSLSLGPQHNTDLLKRFTGHAKALRSLMVQTWAGKREDLCPELEDFLMSFDMLEELTVRGHFVSNRALGNHPRLKRLCLHSIELPRDGARRPTLGVADLSELDAKCPDLEELEIDVYRDTSGWPEDVTRTLASGFANLRHLTLHCEVGIDWENRIRGQRGRDALLLPKLDADLAKAFAETFFPGRPRSTLETLTLKTGEALRRFPQWPPAYLAHERQESLTVHIRAPSSPDGVLTVDIEPKS